MVGKYPELISYPVGWNILMAKSVGNVIWEYVGWFLVPTMVILRLVYSAISARTATVNPAEEKVDAQTEALRAVEFETKHNSYGKALPKFGKEITEPR